MQKPTGVIVLAVLDFVAAASLVLGALAAVGLSLMGAAFIHRLPVHLLAGLGVLAGLVLLVLAALAGLLGWGMLNLQNWARVTTIVLAAISLLGALPGFFFLGWGMHMPLFWTFPIVRMAVDVLIIWYLLQPQVKRAFAAAW